LKQNAVTHTVIAQTIKTWHAALDCEIAEFIGEHEIKPLLKPVAEIMPRRRLQPAKPSGVDLKFCILQHHQTPGLACLATVFNIDSHSP